MEALQNGDGFSSAHWCEVFCTFFFSLTCWVSKWAAKIRHFYHLLVTEPLKSHQGMIEKVKTEVDLLSFVFYIVTVRIYDKHKWKSSELYIKKGLIHRPSVPYLLIGIQSTDVHAKGQEQELCCSTCPEHSNRTQLSGQISFLTYLSYYSSVHTRLENSTRTHTSSSKPSSASSTSSHIQHTLFTNYYTSIDSPAFHNCSQWLEFNTKTETLLLMANWRQIVRIDVNVFHDLTPF